MAPIRRTHETTSSPDAAAAAARGEQVDLDALRWLARAADAGSLSLAARRARVAQSTVSRAIGRLERALGVALFERTGRAVRLTDAGQAVHDRAQEVLRSVTDLTRAAAERQGALSGVLRLSLCTLLGRHRLLPRLTGWATRSSGVVLDVHLEERPIDPLTDGFDVVVRAGRPPDTRAHATALGSYGHALVAAPRVAQRLSRLDDPAGLARASALVMRIERPWTTWVFSRASEVARVEVTPKLIVTDAEALLDAALAGAGVTVLPDYLVASALRSRALVRVLPEWTLPRIPVVALHAPKRGLPRVVRDALRELSAAMDGEAGA